jgi:hypothetical protein
MNSKKLGDFSPSFPIKAKVYLAAAILAFFELR